ncbi:MAG: hypothetical protein ACLTKG_04825 [Collinsella intestinalis]
MDEGAFADAMGGRYNSWILTRASIDIVEHSYGKDRIEMSEELFEEIRRAKRENYAMIYHSVAIEEERGHDGTYVQPQRTSTSSAISAHDEHSTILAPHCQD